MKHPAIVTGGASGIGMAVVKRLLDDGWPVAVVDADADALASAESAFADENAIFLAADVTDEDDLGAAFDEIVDRLGLVGGLVNSAGIVRDLPADETSAELFREILDVNLVGSFIASRAALERMGATLSIVNIGSVSGIRANRGRVAYGASKAGLKLMSEVLALEFGNRGVRVNCVAPGPIETPMVSKLHGPDEQAALDAPDTAGALWRARGSGGGRRLPAVARGELRQRPHAVGRWRLPFRRAITG